MKETLRIRHRKKDDLSSENYPVSGYCLVIIEERSSISSMCLSSVLYVVKWILTAVVDYFYIC